MNPALSSSKKSKFFVALLLLSSLSAFNTALATKVYSENAPQTVVQNSSDSSVNSPQQPAILPVKTPEQQNFAQSETVTIPIALWYSLLGLLATFAVVLLTLLIRRPSKMKNTDISNIPDDKKSDQSLPPESPLSEWLIVDYSAIGSDHIKKGIPCQDSRYIESINSQWGVAVCCDGAGSKINSHIGSEFVAEETAKMLAFGIKAEQWHTNEQLPSVEAWREMAVQVLNQINLRLERHAQEKDLNIDTLGCTVIVVVYSPFGLLVAHIGDGRAAYCNEAGKWISIMTPLQGEYAGETVFITTPYVWKNIEKFIETRVINDKPFGFTLMSDGCESFAFTTQVNTAENEGELKLVDVNEPFEPFYAFAVSHLKEFYKMNNDHAAIQTDWANILEEGSDRIKNEPDDKTMILGILV